MCESESGHVAWFAEGPSFHAPKDLFLLSDGRLQGHSATPHALATPHSPGACAASLGLFQNPGVGSPVRRDQFQMRHKYIVGLPDERRAQGMEEGSVTSHASNDSSPLGDARVNSRAADVDFVAQVMSAQQSRLELALQVSLLALIPPHSLLRRERPS